MPRKFSPASSGPSRTRSPARMPQIWGPKSRIDFPSWVWSPAPFSTPNTSAKDATPIWQERPKRTSTPVSRPRSFPHNTLLWQEMITLSEGPQTLLGTNAYAGHTKCKHAHADYQKYHLCSGRCLFCTSHNR